MVLKGARILITQNDIFSINGSSVIVFELARHLISVGAHVKVYSYFIHDPLKAMFEDAGIETTDAEDEIRLEDFDYVWVHQQVLPLSVIMQLGNSNELVELPKFIFNHMSPLDYIADEFPYIHLLEDRLSSLSLFHSGFTLDLQAKLLDDSVPKSLYPNPSPDSFKNDTIKKNKAAKRILVVSNHPPDEILKLKNKFHQTDIAIDFLGERQQQYDLISPDILNKYDVVISIGKTVQNCLVAGVPVYVYDHFGGPGYLNSKNYDLAEYRNFSRGFDKKTTDQIYEEIIDGLDDARAFIAEKQEYFTNTFTISQVVDRVFSDIKKRDIEPFDFKYTQYLLYSHNYSREHRIASRYRVILEGELRERARELDLRNQELKLIKQSRAYGMGNLLAYPIRKIKKWNK